MTSPSWTKLPHHHSDRPKVIISHAHKFIFFAVPKTGSQSIRQALGPHLAQGDWQQHALFGQERLPIPELAARGHGHLSVCDVAPFLPSKVWDTYLKFAFVRNPFERFVSAYVFLFRKAMSADHSPEETTADMKAALHRRRFRQRILIQPQSQFLQDREGNLALDLIGRYERLEADFERVCQRLGLSASLPRANPSDHAHYSQYYDDELRGMVADFYASDLRNFGYSFSSV